MTRLFRASTVLLLGLVMACGGSGSQGDVFPGDVLVDHGRLDAAEPDVQPGDHGDIDRDGILPTDHGGDAVQGDPGGIDGSDGDLGGIDIPPECPRLPGPEDGIRKVVVSHPFNADGTKSNRYSVLDLSTDGTLSLTGVSFEMGRQFDGEIVFTPDGEIGMAVQEGGSIGIFRLEPGGGVQVIDEAFKPTYGSRIVMDPSGQMAWVLHTGWREHGGGIHSVAIGCDGTPGYEGLVAPAKLPYQLLLLPGSQARAVVAAKDILESGDGMNAHLVAWGASHDVLDGIDAFGYDDAIMTAGAVMPDGRFVLLGDNSGYSDYENRVVIVEVDGDSLVSRGALVPIEDPAVILASPFGNAALVFSAFGNQGFLLSHDPDGDPPFQVEPTPSWVGKRPQLPGSAVMIRRGALVGHILVSEVEGIRQVDFLHDGTISDRGVFSLGEGMENMPGGIGVQF